MTRPKCISAFFIAILMMTALGCVSTSAEEETGQSVDGRDIMNKKKAAIVLSLIYRTGKSSGQCRTD